MGNQKDKSMSEEDEKPSIHLFSITTCPALRVAGGGGARRGASWTGHQFITGFDGNPLKYI